MIYVRFDAPLILRHMKKFGLLEEFQSIVKGFVDTLLLFRNLLPDRKKEKKIIPKQLWRKISWDFSWQLALIMQLQMFRFFKN